MRYFLWIAFIFILGCQNTSVENKPVEQLNPDSNLVKKVSLLESKAPEVDSSITIEYLMGKFKPAKDKRFSKIAASHASNASMILRKEAYDAFKEMAKEAKKDGVSLKIISATRPFAHQKRIWEAKWNGGRIVDGQNLSKTIPDPAKRALKILEFSSMPGSSRHHWGTDIDINALTNGYFEKGRGKKEYDWLVANAPRFGYCQPYSPKGTERPYGYNEEKWHWSYLPIAKKLTEQYQLRIKDSDIKGFAGANVAPQIKIVDRYVLGINKACLD